MTSEQRYFEAHPFEWLYRRVVRGIIVAAVGAGLGLVALEIADHMPARYTICIGDWGAVPESVVSICSPSEDGDPRAERGKK